MRTGLPGKILALVGLLWQTLLLQIGLLEWILFLQTVLPKQILLANKPKLLHVIFLYSIKFSRFKIAIKFGKDPLTANESITWPKLWMLPLSIV